MILKPHLACDWVEGKQRFPVFVQPKVDGVRGLNLQGRFTGRSLKPHGNRWLQEAYSKPLFLGLDVEIAAERPNHPDLCRLTTSAVNSYEGQPELDLWAFDLLTEETRSLQYFERLGKLETHVQLCNQLGERNIFLTPTTLVTAMEDLLELEESYLADGYEGVILRDPEGLYKSGRATVREGALLRIKRFVEEEAEVLEVVEGHENLNEARKNELGRTERSSHQENLRRNGMLGALICRDLKTKQEITVSAGALTHEERKYFFENQTEILGKVIKYRHFPKGGKDKPRFPTFHSFRIRSDMS